MTARSLPASFEIAGCTVGAGAPTYVIAEAGANHNRDIAVARELIDVAAEAGADAVKFQVYSGRALYSSKMPRFRYLRGISEKPASELLEDVALPREWIGDLAAHARSRAIHFFATPFDTDAVEELCEAEVPAMKVASFELVDLELIAAAATTGLPLILSCGMASYGEIEDALGAVQRGGGARVALLRCASLYPSPPEIMNLRAMSTMRAAFGVPVGLSDHTEGIAVALGARGLGMELLEKHFTLDRGMSGPDHPFALEPGELRELVAGIRAIEQALGNGRLEGPSAPEAQEMYRLARRSVIAARDIPAGTQIAREHLVVKRPGYGIAPKDIDRVVGRIARVDIEADEVLTWEQV
ncbi:MAG TPA: N-acetylneuraminate synthase family protein [Solirubrobacteraceae bacterium]|jgi:N,N'-diacetyllegionaminate synthase|nr:N-acetylneuraminate synthase family protein [Solirubrobacteraceae bacterium]